MYRVELLLKKEENRAMGKKKTKNAIQNFQRENHRSDLLSCVIDGTIEEVRARVWKLHSGCLSAINDKKNKNYFDNIIGKFPAYPNPSLHQIELDLVRTSIVNSDGIDLADNDPSLIKSIRRVLKAYIYRNPLIGYVQGFNFILAKLVTVISSPNDLFWMFTMLLENILPLDYYSHMLGVRADSFLYADILLP